MPIYITKETVVQICPKGLVHTHYPGGISKRRFDSENASNVFRPHNTGGISKRAAITGRFGFVFEKPRTGKSHDNCEVTGLKSVFVTD